MFNAISGASSAPISLSWSELWQLQQTLNMVSSKEKILSVLIIEYIALAKWYIGNKRPK